MKKILLIASLSALTVFSAYSQEKAADQSKAEAFSAKSGTLIQKQFTKVGQVKTVEIKVLALKDLINNITTSAVRFEAILGSGYSAGTKIGAVDADELDGLIKSIKIIQSSIFTTTPALYTEVSFKSRGGFEAGCFYDEDKKKWSAYLQLSRFDSKSSVFMSAEDFAQLLIILEQAKGKLV